MSAPSRAVCAQVDARDSWSCVRCGRSLEVVSGSRHHRQRRRDGGHLVENLILLCGSGTTGCHGWVHRNPAAARRAGLIVRSSVPDVSVLPVHTWEGWYLLRADGSKEPVVSDLAHELLAAWGEASASELYMPAPTGAWAAPAPVREERWS